MHCSAAFYSTPCMYMHGFTLVYKYIWAHGTQSLRAHGGPPRRIRLLFFRVDFRTLFFIDFGWIWVPFWYRFSCFSMLCTSLFRACILRRFSFHFWTATWFGEPSATRILLHESCGFRTFTFFKTHVFSAKLNVGFRSIPAPFLHWYSLFFHVFFGLHLHIVFSSIWDGQWLPK